MNKFLLDANISPLTREYLERTFQFDVIDLLSIQKGNISDQEVVALAKKEKRIIITFDLDFGEIYHFRENGTIGIIILRLEDQTVKSVNNALYNFFINDAKGILLENSLVIIEEDKIRRYT